jgi:two-component system, NtrC family, response regulator
VRELQNRVKRAVIMASGSRVTAKDIELCQDQDGAPSSATSLREAREHVEREMIEQALKRNSGKITSAAADLGISRPTLYELMEKLGITNNRISRNIN